MYGLGLVTDSGYLTLVLRGTNMIIKIIIIIINKKIKYK